MSVREKFRRVAGQRLVRISADVLALEEEEDHSERLAGLLRDVHTLKGEAGVLGLRPISNLSHALEDLLAAFQTERAELSPEAIDVALHALDVLAQLVEGGEFPEETISELSESLRAGIGDAPAGPPREIPGKPASSKSLRRSSGVGGRPGGSAPEGMANPTRERGTRQLQVDPARFGRLSAVTGDLLVLVERGAERSQALVDLTRRVRRRLTAHQEAPEWARELEELAREYRQDAFSHSLRIQELSEQLRVLRLSPLTSLLEGYRRAVRDQARSLGKEAQLVIEAAAVEVDQSVLEVISEPLLHLVRNAIAHGLETPPARESSGKSPQGTIRIGVTQTGSHVEIIVEDDGQGIDPRLVAMIGEMRGLLTPEEAAALSTNEAYELLFTPGFSTSALDQVSGRGVGLDVVRRTVEEHQGSLQLESEPGHGTRFTLRIPMNLAMGEALIVLEGQSHYAISADVVSRVARLERDLLCPLGKGLGYRLGERVLPLRSLGDFVGRPHPPRPGDPLVLIEARGAAYALVVSEVLGQRTVVFRPLDPFLAEQGTVQASCVLADGAIALLLNPVSLIGGAGPRQRPKVGPDPGGESPRKTKRVLVVEDSPVTRDLVLEIVRSAGYEVTGAEDGLQALETFSAFRPDLVLTDLEMPRMNGIELTRRLRKLGHTTAVVVITTRASDAERRECMQAGADAFIDKSRFREAALLETVQRLVG